MVRKKQLCTFYRVPIVKFRWFSSVSAKGSIFLADFQNQPGISISSRKQSRTTGISQLELYKKYRGSFFESSTFQKVQEHKNRSTDSFSNICINVIEKLVGGLPNPPIGILELRLVTHMFTKCVKKSASEFRGNLFGFHKTKHVNDSPKS